MRNNQLENNIPILRKIIHAMLMNTTFYVLKDKRSREVSILYLKSSSCVAQTQTGRKDSYEHFYFQSLLQEAHTESLVQQISLLQFHDFYIVCVMLITACCSLHFAGTQATESCRIFSVDIDINQFLFQLPVLGKQV